MLIAVDISLNRLINHVPWNHDDLIKRINYVEQPTYHIRNTFPGVDRVYIPHVDSTKNLLSDLENCCVNYGVPDKTGVGAHPKPLRRPPLFLLQGMVSRYWLQNLTFGLRWCF